MLSKLNLKNIDKKLVLMTLYHYFLVTIGCGFLALGTALFLTKTQIVAGGLSGIGIIVQHFVDLYFDDVVVLDIVVYVLNVLLWIVSLIFLGRSFAAKTLWATIVFPVFLTLFLRVQFFDDLATQIAGDMKTGDLLLCGLFGGIISGIGVAITFLGKGTTGGVDVISFILNKYFGFKVAVVGLLLDSAVILTGLFALDFPQMVINALCGIIASAMMAVMIQILYSKKQNAIILEVISSEWEIIANYILITLSRGVTYIDGVGAYTNEKRRVIRCVLSHEEYQPIKEYIAKIDPKAFITFTETNAAFGEGFNENISSRIFRKKSKKMKK